MFFSRISISSLGGIAYKLTRLLREGEGGGGGGGEEDKLRTYSVLGIKHYKASAFEGV